MSDYPGAEHEGQPLFGSSDNGGREGWDNGNTDDDEDSCCGPNGFYDQNRSCVLGSCVILTIISVILLAFSFDVVKPTEYGLLQNGWTGWVDNTEVYPAGRHFVFLKNFFINFPAYRVSIEFSSSADANAPPVPGRTGRDLNDPDSGGQPVTLSFAFQYQLEKDDVGKVYKEFGAQYESRYLLFARMAVSDVAQKYTPDKFWTERSTVSEEMFKTMKEMLRESGHCTVTGFQLLQVDFPTKYEDMITDIQLQVQYKLTSEYQQKVTNVLKNIDVLSAITGAKITAIKAEASAKASVLVNEATTEGFKMQQEAKAAAYANMQKELALTNQEMLEYVKIKALTTSGSHKVLGTAQPALVYG